MKIKDLNISRTKKPKFNRYVDISKARHYDFMPNFMTTLANSANALQAFYSLKETSSSLTEQEKVAVRLIVSEVHRAGYCLSVHTKEALELGFTLVEILEVRTGKVCFNNRIAVLVNYTKYAAICNGHVGGDILEEFFTNGFTNENLADVIVLIAEKTITNYLYAAIGFPLDFPPAYVIETEDQFE